MLYCSLLSVQKHHDLKELEWVAISFSRGSSRPRNWTRVFCITQTLYHLSYQGSPWRSLKTRNRATLWPCNAIPGHIYGEKHNLKRYMNPKVQPKAHSSSQWCHPAISSSVIPFSSCPQSLPASESFPVSQLFAWGGQSTGFLPKKSQGWSPSEWTGWISLQSKGLSRVLSNTTVQKHQFFGAQLSSQSNSHIHTWLLEKP